MLNPCVAVGFHSLQLFHFQAIEVGDGVQGLTGLNNVHLSPRL